MKFLVRWSTETEGMTERVLDFPSSCDAVKWAADQGAVRVVVRALSGDMQQQFGALEHAASAASAALNLLAADPSLDPRFQRALRCVPNLNGR